MLAYKKYVTIKDSKSLTLTELPFREGQRVEIVMISDDDERAEKVKALKKLLKKTQKLPAAQKLTEDEITAEIKAYRAGQ